MTLANLFRTTFPSRTFVVTIAMTEFSKWLSGKAEKNSNLAYECVQIIMSKSQNSSSSSPIKGESSATPDILSSDSDETFFRSLYEFIEHEKEYQQCPEEGPDQLRYTIYRSVFNKVFFKSFHITE